MSHFPQKSRSVELVAAPCYRRNGVWHGDFEVSKTTRLEFPTVHAAKRAAWSYKRKGMTVILRPRYNETDAKGRYFRDWRSFDGGVLRECIFRIPG
jgi:hypothetical protein